MQLTNLQQFHDAVMSLWNKISKAFFQQLVQPMPQRIKGVLKQNRTEPSASKVYLINCPVTAYEA